MLSRHNFDVLLFGGISLLIALHLVGVSDAMLMMIGFAIFFPGIPAMLVEVQRHISGRSFYWNTPKVQISCKLTHWLIWGCMTAMFYPTLRLILFLGIDPRKLLTPPE